MNHYGYRVSAMPPSPYPPRQAASAMLHDDFELRQVAIEHAQRLEAKGWSVECFEVLDSNPFNAYEFDHTEDGRGFKAIQWQMHAVGV